MREDVTRSLSGMNAESDTSGTAWEGIVLSCIFMKMTKHDRALQASPGSRPCSIVT